MYYEVDMEGPTRPLSFRPRSSLREHQVWEFDYAVLFSEELKKCVYVVGWVDQASLLCRGLFAADRISLPLVVRSLDLASNYQPPHHPPAFLSIREPQWLKEALENEYNPYTEFTTELGVNWVKYRMEYLTCRGTIERLLWRQRVELPYYTGEGKRSYKHILFGPIVGDSE